MKYQIILLIAVSLTCLLGCRESSSSFPADSFRLTVEDLLSSEDEYIAVLKIETQQNQTYSLQATNFFMTGGSSKSSIPATAVTDPHRQQAITMLAYRYPSGGDWDCYKTIIKTEYGNTIAGSRWLPKTNVLSQSMKLTAQNGVFPLLKPVLIGSLNGEDLLLTVGDNKRSSGAGR